MVVLCVARHRYLAQHLARFLGQTGAVTRSAVGFSEARAIAAACSPDVVAAEYDLLTRLPLRGWEQDEILSQRPVIAVSLTRRPGDANALDVNGIAGYLYLPEIGADAALRVMEAAAAATTVRAPDGALPWPARPLPQPAAN